MDKYMMSKFITNRFMKKNEHGFTLVELIIALLLLSVLVLVVSGMLAGLPRFYRDLRGEEEEKGEVWTALNFMARELRSARGFSENSTATELIFRNEKDQQIHYKHDTGSNRLQRRVGTGKWAPMIGNIRANDWEIAYSASKKDDPARFTRIVLKLKGESITIRPRMYRGESAGGGWFE
ncbi:MAG: prepilin-type N-terminal cleavage/methylation domain-containing protein [Firmicutes bacterium]|nr:prepilin-type N-terminal cleavage/methylation domain-containing protein [Bacillota bacterium]